MTPPLVTALLLLSNLQGSVHVQDLRVAMKTVEQEMPWSWAFHIKHYCLVDNAPYTMRIALEKGETVRHAECIQPWRSFSWICEERETTCETLELQYEQRD